jgi:hypothetical protein
MKLGPVRRDEKLSSLSVDVALSVVELAALRAKAGRMPDERELLAAGELLEFFRRILQMMRDDTAPLADTVPEEGIRRGLEETLASLAPVATRFHIKDPDLLRRLVELLDALCNRGINAQQAGVLLDTLHNVERGLEETSDSPDLTPLVGIGRRDVR